MNLKHKTYYLLILSSLFIITKVYGQYPTVKERIINLPNFDEKFLHYGYYVGVNSYDYKFEYINDYYLGYLPASEAL